MSAITLAGTLVLKSRVTFVTVVLLASNWERKRAPSRLRFVSLAANSVKRGYEDAESPFIELVTFLKQRRRLWMSLGPSHGLLLTSR